MLLTATWRSGLISFGAWLCTKKQGAPNHSCFRSPRQGAHKTTHGRRSLSGARSKCRSCIQEPKGAGWRFFGRQHLTLARHSYFHQRDAPAAIEVWLLSNTSRTVGPRPSTGGLQCLCFVPASDCQAPSPQPLSGLNGAGKARLIPRDSDVSGRFSCNRPFSAVPARGAARPFRQPSDQYCRFSHGTCGGQEMKIDAVPSFLGSICRETVTAISSASGPSS